MIVRVSRMNTVTESVVAVATCSVLYVSLDSRTPDVCVEIRHRQVHVALEDLSAQRLHDVAGRRSPDSTSAGSRRRRAG